MIQSKEEYVNELSKHDWYYAFSEDSYVYRKGAESMRRLTEAAKVFDNDRLIWDSYAPEHY